MHQHEKSLHFLISYFIPSIFNYLDGKQKAPIATYNQRYTLYIVAYNIDLHLKVVSFNFFSLVDYVPHPH